MPGTVNFDSVARVYRWLEYLSFGPWLSRCRTACLEDLTTPRHALVLGDGDGRFLRRLLILHPRLTADVVDSSERMLRELNGRLRRVQLEGRVQLHHADALTWQPVKQYDLIVTHFFLDCFFPDQLELLFDRILAHAEPGARWVVSEFAIPSNNWVARTIVSFLYRAFGLLTGLRVRALPDYASLLRRRGLILADQHSFLRGLLRSELWFLPKMN
jgi:ubiquinone/menaquinone biosynthesis C-methylase UbiE